MTEENSSPKSLLLTASELGELLGANRSTIWSWHSAGRIPLPVRIGGGCTRWRRSEIEQWLDAGAPGRETWVHRLTIEVASDKQGRIT